MPILNFENLYKEYLISRQPALQDISVKNYLSDLRKFIAWFEATYTQEFKPQDVHFDIIRAYKQSLQESAYHMQSISAKAASNQSIERYFSSLRKFFNFLQQNGYIYVNPFSQVSPRSIDDPYLLKAFRNYLGQHKSSPATIKNYLTDTQLFLFWFRTTYQNLDLKKEILSYLTPTVINEYKKRLLEEKISPSTINRRLSSLKSYYNYLDIKQKINNGPIELNCIPHSDQDTTYNNVSTNNYLSKKEFKYSSFPPLRLWQKLTRSLNLLVDYLLIIPLTYAVVSGQYLLWNLSGKKIFVPTQQISPRFGSYIQNRMDTVYWSRHRQKYSESFLSPITISNNVKQNQSIHKFISPKLTFAMIGALLFFLVIAEAVVFLVFKPLASNQTVLGLQSAQRLLYFQGKLLDASQKPITQPTEVRFSLYNDPTGSGSALLWQTVHLVKPNNDGGFQITLGQSESLPQTIFSDNPSLYLGTTIATNAELTPREAIPSTSLSSDSLLFNGMSPVNTTSGLQRNVVLSLDSAGNLQIAGSSSPTFSATNGTFTLSGNLTVIKSNDLSNGNVVIAPDGSGMIDLQKPLTNTALTGNFPDNLGAVEVDDRLAVWATSSAQPALQIEQDGLGPLLNASSSGVSKFTVSYTGTGTFADNLAINGGSLTSSASTFNLLNDGPLELDIGNQAYDINIGSSSGILKINNSTTALSGNLTVNGTKGLTFTGDNAGINFSGYNDHVIEATQGALLINNAKLNNPQFNSNVIINNQLGIGTSNPLYKLDVVDNRDATVSAMISNTNTSANASALALKLGATYSSLTPNNKFIDFLDINGQSLGSITSNGMGGLTFSGHSNGDFAEYLPKDPNENIPTGALACFTSSQTVTQCSSQSYSSIAGVISASPTILAGQNNGAASIPVGFVGQLQVRVSTQNGSIQPGDPISVSNIPGVGVKATSAGPIIGHALASYTSNDPYLIDLILVVVQPSWYDPAVQITDAGNLNITMPSNSQAGNGSQPSYQLSDNNGHILSSIAAYAWASIANLQVGLVNTKDLIVTNSADFMGTLQASAIQTTQLSTNNILIAGVSLQDYVNNLIHQSNPGNANPLSPSIGNLAVNVISPLGTQSAIIINGNANINGNASVSGQLTSNTLQTTSATVSGTFYAHKIVADEIQGLNASPSATYITNVTNVYQNATPSAQPTTTLVDNTTATSSGIENNILPQELASQAITPLPNDINLASYSAQLTDANLQVSTLDVTTGLMSSGTTSLADTAIAGQLTIDGRLSIADTEINVVGSDLQLQPLRQGGVNFLGGLLTIDTNGNLNVAGNAVFNQNVTVSGTLAVNTLSPLANHNLSIQLATPSASNDPGLNINNASGSAVLTLTQQGDLNASGSGNFAQIVSNALTIVHGAQADTSITETVATASAGTAVIYRGQTERTIITPYAHAKSLIYISPSSDTYGQTPYIARQTDPQINPGQPNSFTIQISSPIDQDIHLNWWIVN